MRSWPSGGQPQAIRCDDVPELTSRHFLAWCVERQIELVHIQPGEHTPRELPRTAAGRVFGSELVSEPVRCTAEDCGVAEGVQRGAPDSSLGYRTPKEFAAQAGIF